MPDDQRPPWRSEKVWLAVIGVVALVVLSKLGTIDLQGYEIPSVIVSLILGRAHEGAAARKAG